MPAVPEHRAAAPKRPFAQLVRLTQPTDVAAPWIPCLRGMPLSLQSLFHADDECLVIANDSERSPQRGGENGPRRLAIVPAGTRQDTGEASRARQILGRLK